MRAAISFRSRALLLLLALCATILFDRAAAAVDVVPRTVIALYDSRTYSRWRDTQLHQMAELPLNHLGLVLMPHDISKGLPDIASRPDVRGVVSWFEGEAMDDPRAYLRWANAVAAAGKRFVILGDLFFLVGRDDRVTPLDEVNSFLSKLGFLYAGDSVRVTYDVRTPTKNASMVEYERPLSGILPPYPIVHRTGSDVTVHLALSRGNSTELSDVVLTGPRGGYVASGYTHFLEPDSPRRSWRINPFEFFRASFGTDDLPKPDVTTRGGRRLFFSHIDGDGWRNISELPEYRKARKNSAEVILHEILERYPDMPVTVAPIVADLDPAWCGSEAELALARRIFALPHIDPASHTWTHPLDWSFFESGNLVEKEKPFLPFYPKCGRDSDATPGLLDPSRLLRKKPTEPAAAGMLDQDSNSDSATDGYTTPRSYANQPFDVRHEMVDAADYITKLAPAGKKVELVQWSGNTLPFARAIAEARSAGIRNINGGDTRFDTEYPTVSWVAPVGRRVDDQWQVYSPNSNENTFTDLWSNRFFGFRYLLRTTRNTETPIRLKAFSVYYHFYSGEKVASLRALREIMEAARKAPLHPIRAVEYAASADGFFSARIVPLGPSRWRIENRDALATVRFDNADAQSVNFAASEGVLGYTRHIGSLYVALDPAVASPVVALGPTATPASRPYLVSSRWGVSALKVNGASWSFTTQGFGEGEMQWRAQPGRHYAVRFDTGAETIVVADAQGDLDWSVGPTLNRPVGVTVTALPSR